VTSLPQLQALPIHPRNVFFGRLLRFLSLALVLAVFFLGLELLGASFKLLGRGVAQTLIQTTSNPFVGLFVGILATSLVQSSSAVTSLVVSIVAGGGLTVSGAIPIVMGANMGTSVTNTFVALGHVTRRDEFRLATAGATVHDMFNLLSVIVLLPLDIAFGVISYPAKLLASGLSDVGGARLMSPVHAVISPIAGKVIGVLGSNGWVVLAAGGSVLFVAIRYMVVILRSMSMDTSERTIHAYLLADAPRALLIGMVLTIMVQSSSITTSTIVPLVAAGIVTVEQIFPLVVGANIGTTITALLAALALASTGSPSGLAALEVAFAHMCFNIFGATIFLPVKFLRDIPLRLANGLGRLAAHNRMYAIAYIVIVFFLFPLLILTLARAIDTTSTDRPSNTVQTSSDDPLLTE
jgi:sodium-dependent phosphate cotransporter